MSRSFTNRRVQALATAATLLLATTASCVTAPHNGASFSGNVVGKVVSFQGYYNEPSYAIRLEVLKDATFNPSTASNWTTFANATTSATPSLYVDTPDPLYLWSVSAAPVPNAAAAARWPQGGLVRIRAVHPDAVNGDRVLTTFDEVNFLDCAVAQPSWGAIGTACVGLGKTTSMFASTTNLPTPPGNAALFSVNGFLGRKGEITPAETDQYYATTGAPATLALFKTKYGFPAANEVTATFYNDGDLGLGREMHCRAFVNGVGQVGVACYVTNYSGVANGSGVGIPAFNVDPDTVLDDAVARQHAFATVAMAYEPPANAVNAVRFVVYDAAGNRANQAQLDSTSNNTSIPNNCLACHGISAQYNAGTNSVSADAKFLPFDPFSYKFSSAAGFTFAAQADAFRKLNNLVRLTNTTATINEFIDGLYAPKLVSDPTAVASDDFVPTGWTTATPDDLDDTALYKGVVKTSCRTCHMSSTNAAYDFASYGDFTPLAALIRSDACLTHVMPHAERVLKNFWQSGARAYLITGLKPTVWPDATAACKP
jgi:cytochrome c553